MIDVIVAGQLRVVVDDLAVVVELDRTDELVDSTVLSEEAAHAFQPALSSAAALLAATTRATDAVVSFISRGSYASLCKRMAGLLAVVLDR